MKSYRRTQYVFSVVLVVLVLASTSIADVYVNRLWDPQQSAFTVQVLDLGGGGVTFDRNYQNAYGAVNDLDPGPPFIIEASISGAGSVSFVSGGFDLTRPFDIFVTPSSSFTGHISASDGVNFQGSSLDPIKIEGSYQIHMGVDYQHDGPQCTWTNTVFNCTYRYDSNNDVPFTLSGAGVTVEDCRFANYSADFFYLMSIIDFNSQPEYEVTFRDCVFRNLDFSGIFYSIYIDNLARLSFESCQFENVAIDSNANGGLVLARDCGVYSIKNNTGSGNTLSKFHIINAVAADSAFIRTNESLPIVANDMVVPPDSVLAIGKGSVIKFLWSGGIETSGRLYADSAVLTSYRDDAHGGDTDLEAQPSPIIDKWKTDGGNGITVFAGGRATLTDTRVLYADGAVRAHDDISLDYCYIADSDNFGITIDAAGPDTFRVSNTTVTRTMDRALGFTGAIVYRDDAGWPQALVIDSVTLIANDVDGVYVSYLADQPTSLSIRDSKIIQNAGYGIYFPSDESLTDFTLTNSLILANDYNGIYSADQTYEGGGGVHVEGNVILGNGYGPYAGSHTHGMSFPNSPPTVVGNTVAYNAGMGLVYCGMDDVASVTVANNLFFRNGDYGIMKCESGAHLLACNDFWENGDQELRYQGPSGRIYTVEEIQALGGEFATNLHVDPQFNPERFGQIDQLSYDEVSRLSKLVDGDGSFVSENLIGQCVCPDTLSPTWHYIVFQLLDTLYVTGNITDSAEAGSTYRIHDFHLSGSSPILEVGRDASVTLPYDIDGQQRQIDGDQDGAAFVDIGADEFDPSAGQPFVRITRPTDHELILAGHPYEITWEHDGVDSVDVFFCADTSFLPWDTLAKGLSAAAGSLEWTPLSMYSLKCRLHIVSTADSAVGDLTGRFTVKGYELCSITADSMLDPYQPSLHGWSFGNVASSLWPAAWYGQFDYEAGIDSITGAPYPPFFANDFWYGAQPSDFPDWPLFVDAFRFDQCYYTTPSGPVYRPSAVAFWGDNKGSWGGSCSGLATSSVLGFFDSTAFLGAYPGVGSFMYLHDLTVSDDRRKAINELWVHQMGDPHYTRYQEATATPRQTLEALKDHLLNNFSDGRNLSIGNTRLGSAHDVLPYALISDTAMAGLYRVYVYDSNHPSDDARFILIDSAANSWSYADFPVWGDADGYILLGDSASSYFQTPVLRAGGSGKMRVPAAWPAGDLRVYGAPLTDIMMIDTLGRRVGYDDSIIVEITGARPIISRTGVPGPPRGYELPTDAYTAALENREAGRLSFAIYDDSSVYRYSRSTANPGEVDSLTVDSVLTVANHETVPRACQMHCIGIGESSEKEIVVSDWQMAQGEQVSFRLRDGTDLEIWNGGAAGTVPVRLRLSSTEGFVEAEASGVNVPGAGAHSTIVPDWGDPTLQNTWIFWDYENDGAYDDSSLLSIVTGVVDPDDPALPRRFDLAQNYPNPFNPVTTIEYSLPHRDHVTIEVFNILGQKIRTLVDREEPAGSYEIIWDATDDSGRPAATGVYLYRLRAGEYRETKKMLLLR